jgi:hypothetical protein
MRDQTYFLIARLIDRFYWRGTLLGKENLPDGGPAVFVANHIGPNGPIGTVCSVPLRLYPWVISDMMNPNLAAAYLEMDFVRPWLHLRPPLSRLVAKGISLISVSLLTSLGGIPVNRQDYGELKSTLQLSLQALLARKIVLVFPEGPELELNPTTNMRPFLKGFTRLGELFYVETGEQLRFYPIAVHESRQVRVGIPVRFDPANPPSLERRRLRATLESRIVEMYLQMRGV